MHRIASGMWICLQKMMVCWEGGGFKKNSGPDVINLVEIDLKWFITSYTMGLVFKC